MNHGWHGPGWHNERRESLYGRNRSIGTVKRPAADASTTFHDPLRTLEEDGIFPGAYAVARDGLDPETFSVDEQDSDSIVVSLEQEDEGIMVTHPEDHTRIQQLKSCIARKKRTITTALFLCCVIVCIVIAVILSLPSDLSDCQTSPTDPFIQCNLCGRKIADLNDELRATYELVRNNAEIRDQLEDLIDIHSCLAVNKALIWAALDLKGVATTFPHQRIINRFTLVLFYTSMGGEDWTKQDKWLSDAHECDWYGIGCDSRRIRLLSIHLTKNYLVGTLEARLGLLLPNLRVVDFTGNRITGSIPSEIFGLPDLEELLLGSNKLDGTMPSMPEANRTNLLRLVLTDNDLTGAIPNLSGLAKLTDLRLFCTLMTGTFPLESLAKLSRLETLELQYLRNDQPLLLPSLTSLTNLRRLDLLKAKLDGTIPESLGNLTLLEYLRLAGSNLSGTIPTTLGLLTNLTLLHIGGNWLDGSIPSELGSISQLSEIVLARNRLEGTIPSTFAECTKLMKSDLSNLSDTLLTGEIPESFDSLVGLQHVHIECSGIQLPTLSNTLCNQSTAIHLDPMTQNQSALARCTCCQQHTDYCQHWSLRGSTFYLHS